MVVSICGHNLEALITKQKILLLYIYFYFDHNQWLQMIICHKNTKLKIRWMVRRSPTSQAETGCLHCTPRLDTLTFM